MSTYFTIGEVSKLFNLPIKTLRYYDEKGVLKPAYINQKTKYRYYSREQFMSIDIIKYCKLIGMSLEEIKRFINSDSSIEVMIDNMNKQSELISRKIEELAKVKSYVDGIKDSIIDIINYDLGEIYIRKNEDRIYTQYDYNDNENTELDLKLREVILYLEEKYNDVYPLLGVTSSYISIANEGKIKYKSICDFTTRDGNRSDSNKLNGKKIVIPKGDYITIFFDDNWSNMKKYYDKMIEYINKNNLRVEGDFYEVWAMPRVDSNGKEKTFGYIEILTR